jgi:hypothetical protein
VGGSPDLPDHRTVILGLLRNLSINAAQRKLSRGIYFKIFCVWRSTVTEINRSADRHADGKWTSYRLLDADDLLALLDANTPHLIEA